MDRTEFACSLDRVGVNVDLRGWRPYPAAVRTHGTGAAARRTAPMAGTPPQAISTGSTARCCAALDGEAVAGAAGASHPAGVLLHRPGRTAFDLVLDRECDYGLGFMTNLAGHRFGKECSPTVVRPLRQRRLVLRVRRSRARPCRGGRLQRDHRPRFGVLPTTGADPGALHRPGAARPGTGTCPGHETLRSAAAPPGGVADPGHGMHARHRAPSRRSADRRAGSPEDGRAFGRILEHPPMAEARPVRPRRLPHGRPPLSAPLDREEWVIRRKQDEAGGRDVVKFR